MGQYADPQFSNTVEVWLTVPVAYPSGSRCTGNARIYIDAKHYHVLAAAYLAFWKGSTIKFAVDDSSSMRNGSCEVIYHDIL